MSDRQHPIVWIIGATRSCKTAIAENGVAPLGFQCISTGDYFRNRFGQEDTFSRSFVFNISAFAASVLSEDPDCHHENLASRIKHIAAPCVVEGERNPHEFAKLYDPLQDMVFIVEREDIDPYDTAIERGIPVIVDGIRWAVNAGIAPQASVLRVRYGLEEIRAELFGVNGGADEVILSGNVPLRKEEGSVEDRYPWINIVIGFVRERISGYYQPEHGKTQLVPAPSL